MKASDREESNYLGLNIFSNLTAVVIKVEQLTNKSEEIEYRVAAHYP